VQLKRLIVLLLAPLSTLAVCPPSCTVKAAGGGDFTTIGACMSAMTGGTTCTVFAGTYAESPTIPAGTGSGTYNILTVNGSDTVTITAATSSSHTKLIGNCPALQGTVTSANCGFFITNPSSPTSNCISVAANATDFYVMNNVGYACGGYTDPNFSTPSTFGYILSNTFSYACSTVASPNTCTPINIFGDHKIIENNDISHFNNGAKAYGEHIVFRGNNFHDAHTGETGSNSSGDDHMDLTELSGTLSLFVLFEGNTVKNWFVDGGAGSPAAHGGTLAQCGTGPCGNTILRFQLDYHIQGGATTADQGNWPDYKEYNNSWVDMNNGVSSSAGVNNQNGSTGGANVNEIYYFVTNPTGGWQPYIYGSSGSGQTFGHALAFCPNESISSCTSGLLGHAGGSWTGDPGNSVADPLFINNATDFHLQVGSPALNAGTNLTTVAAGDSGSGTSLVVNDANYFQDGWGLPAGTGLGQVTPDCISITTVGNHVCIVSINYATNTITMASGFSRSNGDPVWLYSDSTGIVRLTGSAPNIGAFGAGAQAPASAGCTLSSGAKITGAVTCQ
jgi:hypothetical protein